MDTDFSIKEGDRIIYFGDEPYRGTVRWLGHIEDICSGVTAGIELDQPCGTNSGAWAGRTLFKCKKNYGVFINLAGLIKEEDFGGHRPDDDDDDDDGEDEELCERVGGTKNVDFQAGIQPHRESDELFTRLKGLIVDGRSEEAAQMASTMAQMYSSTKRKEKPIGQAPGQREKRATNGKAKNMDRHELLLKVEVQTKDDTKTKFKISVPSNSTINTLAEKVEREFSYEFNRQRWFFNDDMITDYSRSVKELNSLSPVLYIREKGSPSGSQAAAVEGNEKVKQTPIAKADPNIVNKAVKEKPDPNAGWVCTNCTFVNEPTRPGCSMCTNARPDDYVVKTELEEKYKKSCEKAEREFLEKFERKKLDNYQKYLELDERKLIPNSETFECKVCYSEIEPGEGIQLRECLHNFCRDCIKGTIVNGEDIPIQCPYADDSYDCQCVLQDREIANILSEEELQKYNARCWAKAAGGTPNSYYCKTPDCKGWCVYEYGALEFRCPVCGHTSCITCQAIHEGKNCKEYQDDLKLDAQNNDDARKTQEKIAEMIGEGTAMDCPGCGIIIMKTEGCDGMMCSHCKIEICWATKGRRWGPGGRGDYSGGCGCRAPPGHNICHPNCRNCH